MSNEWTWMGCCSPSLNGKTFSHFHFRHRFLKVALSALHILSYWWNSIGSQADSHIACDTLFTSRPVLWSQLLPCVYFLCNPHGHRRPFFSNRDKNFSSAKGCMWNLFFGIYKPFKTSYQRIQEWHICIFFSLSLLFSPSYSFYSPSSFLTAVSKDWFVQTNAELVLVNAVSTQPLAILSRSSRHWANFISFILEFWSSWHEPYLQNDSNSNAFANGTFV